MIKFTEFCIARYPTLKLTNYPVDFGCLQCLQHTKHRLGCPVESVWGSEKSGEFVSRGDTGAREVSEDTGVVSPILDAPDKCRGEQGPARWRSKAL